MTQHRFDRWRFDSDTGDLLEGQATIRLEPKVAKLLEYFLLHQNTLISRDELIAEVWEGRVVSDDAINRCISILRQMLSPDDRNAYIETVVRRGFVSHFPHAPAGKPHAALAPRRRKHLILTAAIGVAAVLLYSVFRGPADSRLVTQDVRKKVSPMVAVLPFASADMVGDSAFFANGMHDDLLTRLAQLQSLRVISRTSVLGYRDRKGDIREIGRELGADAILEGSIQRVGDQIRINVQLIDARSDVHLWAEQYDRELSTANIFQVQTEIARAITAALQTALTEQDVRELAVLPTENMAAYRAYHKAMAIRDNLFLADPAYFAALEEAVALDPAYVRAWAELAGGLCFANFPEQDPGSIERIEHILERIRELAPGSADYLIAQAYYTYYILKSYDQAYQFISQAQQLRPSDERILELKSWIQRRLGDFAGRTESLRHAQRLDPKNPRWTTSLVNNLLINHQYAEAAREVASAPLQTFEVAVAGSILQLQKGMGPAGWAAELAALEKEYGAVADPWDWWDVHIANRDFLAAEATLGPLEAATARDRGWLIESLFRFEVSQIMTYWFLQSGDRLEELLARGRARLEERRVSQGDFTDNSQYLVLALFAAVEGDAEETERLIRVWRRAADADLAELTNLRHYACRILGMAAAATAAVECIRDALVEPSHAMPFVEPYLPYYDSIRENPDFTELTKSGP